MKASIAKIVKRERRKLRLIDARLEDLDAGVVGGVLPVESRKDSNVLHRGSNDRFRFPQLPGVDNDVADPALGFTDRAVFIMEAKVPRAGSDSLFIGGPGGDLRFLLFRICARLPDFPAGILRNLDRAVHLEDLDADQTLGFVVGLFVQNLGLDLFYRARKRQINWGQVRRALRRRRHAGNAVARGRRRRTAGRRLLPTGNERGEKYRDAKCRIDRMAHEGLLVPEG